MSLNVTYLLSDPCNIMSSLELLLAIVNKTGMFPDAINDHHFLIIIVPIRRRSGLQASYRTPSVPALSSRALLLGRTTSALAMAPENVEFLGD